MSRVVMFVFNDCTKDARVLREAASLAASGHAVTIMARPRDLASVVGDREERDGFEIVRVPIPGEWRPYWLFLRNPWRARGWFSGFVKGHLLRFPVGWLQLLAFGLVGILASPLVLIRGLLHVATRARHRPPMPGGSLMDWLLRWQFSTLGWARDAAAAAPPADVYHGHDLTGLPAAIAARQRHGGQVVYDSHEIFMESGSNANRPRAVRRWFARRERTWVATCAALVTVNRSLGEVLGKRLRPRRVVVVHNCPARWTPPPVRPQLLRETLGIPADSPVALYHGAFSAHRGMEQLAAAILEPGMESTHGVFLGYGSERANLDLLVAEPRFGDRLHVLDAVPPEELLPWVASADVAVMAIQRSTLNHYLSTPNKLFEALAAGVPVAGSDFPEIRRILLDDPDGPLGELCDPASSADLARAIRAVLERSPEAMTDLRARCLRAAHERWNWETEVARLVALYADIAADIGPPARTEPPTESSPPAPSAAARP